MPRPPPPRAITGCCTCTPRPTPRQRPPSSSHHPPHSLTSSSSHTTSSSPCSSSSHPPHSQPFTTSSTQPAQPALSSPAPVLDFLYPGFGFFSRSLPPLVLVDRSSRSSQSSSSTSSSASIAGPPPPPPVPISTHDSPHYRSQEGRNLLSSSSSSSTSSNLLLPTGGLFSQQYRTKTSWRNVNLGNCVCGRVRETCLRCRGKSTDTRERISPVVVSGMDERIEYKGSNTSAAPSTSSTPNLFDPAILDTPEPTTRSSDPAPSTSTVPDPLTSFRTFFSHLSKTLPSSRTSSSSILPAPSPSTSSPTSTRRRLHRKRSNLSTSPLSLVETLSTHLSDPKVWNELGYYEKLDSIRLFVRITKLLPHNPPLGPLLEPTTSSTSTERDGELLRTKAGERIQYFLDRLENARGSGEQNELSEAGLWIDSFALRGIVETIPAPLRTTSEEISGKFEKSIRTVFGGWEDSIRGKGKGKEEKTKIQAVRTGLASLFESWLMRGNRRREGGELAFKLVYEFELDSIFETTTTSLEGETDDARAIASRKRQELGYNDLLRRQYGLLLGRLGPSPVEWLEAAEEERGERFVAKGLHLVEYLSTSGSAGEARKVWERVEEARVTLEEQRRGEEGAELVQSTEEDRLKSLTKLVDGLIMEGFYEDANALTKELEDLAKQVGTRDETLALVSYRTLAKLASNQGRPEILDRLLKKIDTLTHRTSTSTSLLESFARRIRSKSARSDAQSVRSLFAEIQESTEWTQATKEDQARLWSQVILAQTRINDVEAAIESLRSLVAHGLRPPLSAVNSILFGFARRGEVTTVDALFQQLARGGFDRIRPDTGSWNALVLARTTVRDPSAASRVIAEMRERGGVTPNRQTWTTLMSGLVDGAQWKQTFEVYRFLEQHPSIDMRPDTAATNVVLKACVLTATPARLVIALFRQLLARGFRPNMMTYTLVLQSLTTAGLMDLAEELYLMMDRPSTPDSPALPASMTPVRPDQFIFSTLIAGYLKGDEKAKARACLAEMRRRGIEPSSITLAIVVGSRLDARSTPRKVKMMISEARNLLKEGETGLASMRKTQSTRKDRKLATGDEAVAIFAPIFRSAAKQGLAPAALELLEEIQSRRKRDEVPVELYTMLMDAFRRVEDGEGSANNVKTVWDRLYESIAERFMTLRAPSSTPLPEEFTSHVLTTSQLDLRVDPAQASILSVPLTIFLESMARAERHHIFGITWRALARQGFSFDASNWNVLALYFARDLQLERAFWITENILCRPHDETVPSPSPSDFEADFSHVTRSSAIARNPSRLSTLRENERDQHRKVPLDVTSLLSTPSSESSPANPSRADLDVAKVFGNALKLRQATFWHPYGSVLEALESALEVLTMTEDVEVGPDADTSAAELKEKLVRNHPRTMRAINLWRSRGERKDRERERYLSVQGRSL